MKFNFRKVANIAASAALIGSTVALAAAATFPQPFVTSGNPDVAIVYGSQMDLGAVGTIQGALNLVIDDDSGPVAGSGIPAGADWLKIQDGDAEILSLGEAVNQVFDTVTISNFEDNGNQDIDADNRILAEDLEFGDDNEQYTQEFVLSGDMDFEYFVDDKLNDMDIYEGLDVPQLGFQFDSGFAILNYTLDFDNAVNCGEDFDDCTSENIVIMGKEFYILDFDNTSSTNHFIDLLDTSQEYSMENDESRQITVDDITLNFEVDFLDDDEQSVTFIVDEAPQDDIVEGDTAEIDDIDVEDIFIGVKRVTANSDGVGSVTFSVGKGKLTLTNGEEVQINSDLLSDYDAPEEDDIYEDHLLNAYIDTTGNDWESLTLEWQAASDELWIVPGLELTLPGLDTVKWTFEGLNTGTVEEMTTFNPVADDLLELQTTVKDGAVDLPVLYANPADEDSFGGLGKDDDEELHTSYRTQVDFDLDVDKYFVISYADGDDSESYVFEFDGDIDTVSGDIEVSIKNMAKDEDPKVLDQSDTQETFGKLRLNYIVANEAANNVTLNVTSTTSGPDYFGFDRLFTEEGLQIQLPVDCELGPGSCSYLRAGAINFSAASAADNNFTFVMVEEDGEENIAGGLGFNVSIDFVGTTPRMSASDFTLGGGADSFAPDDDSEDDQGYVYSELSSFVHRLDSDDGSTVEVTYFGAETYGELYLTEAGEGSNSPTPSGDLKILDTDPIPTKHLIVVGGTCVNQIAAQLLGVSSPTCGPQWEAATGVGAGEFLVQSFARSGKIATLVAGWEQPDTASAATWFSTQDNVITDATTKYSGTTSTNSAVLVS